MVEQVSRPKEILENERKWCNNVNHYKQVKVAEVAKANWRKRCSNEVQSK